MIQSVNQTDQEKEVMYMKLHKKELVNMLIQCNKYLDELDKSRVITPDTIKKIKRKKRWISKGVSSIFNEYGVTQRDQSILTAMINTRHYFKFLINRWNMNHNNN